MECADCFSEMNNVPARSRQFDESIRANSFRPRRVADPNHSFAPTPRDAKTKSLRVITIHEDAIQQLAGRAKLIIHGWRKLERC